MLYVLNCLYSSRSMARRSEHPIPTCCGLSRAEQVTNLAIGVRLPMKQPTCSLLGQLGAAWAMGFAASLSVIQILLPLSRDGPWKSCYTALYISFLICNLRRIIVSCRAMVRTQWDIAVKHPSKELPGLKNVLKKCVLLLVPMAES